MVDPCSSPRLRTRGALTMDVRIGTCGYGRYPAPDDWKETYASKLQAYTDAYETVELNRTFYKLPRVKTAEKWRRNAVGDFEFVLKAWQAVTHPSSSPTWNNRREQLTDRQQEEIGGLRPTDSNFEAWERTLAVARALEANVVVVQCPPSFGPTAENIDRMRRFFGTIDREGLDLAWEPRGEWKNQTDRVAEMCGELDLLHVIDPLRYEPVDEHATSYLRLHGLNEDEYDYDYDYSDDELDELANRLRTWSDRRTTQYCMFNNFGKFDDAARLHATLEDGE